jgi:putative endonuclease
VRDKSKQVTGFTARYDIIQRVWWEDFEDVRLAIQREKAMKKRQRRWKFSVIETANPAREDLSSAINSA